MKKRLIVACGVAGIVVAVLFGTNAGNAAVTKGKERPLLTKQLMKGLVAAQCGALKKGLDAKPADDKAWDAVALSAALLNEASYALMADGRCPDGTWATAASQTLRQGSADVLAATEAKDLDAANAAFGNMTQACAACHKAHKK